MSRAVPPAVRERARSRSCPQCRAKPGEKCAPDRAGRSQLHRGRIRDAQQAMELPPYRILPPDEDRIFMELQPGEADTLVASWHKDVMDELAPYPYEAATLLRLALLQAEARTFDNFAVALCLMPLEFITRDEAVEAVERLIARGFVERVDPTHVSVNALALDIIERAVLPAQFRLEWNAAKARWPGPTPPTVQLTLM
ncbi:hypothetical protein NRK68_34395 (plasmid) [Streptomyces yangpuensis]|uniref:DNA-binding phage zinc finger domain-containing protein n=1 Tax=Streptomyces yangpuensis TaxID=1648182 RepID=A0ABY5Q7T2_9ACTN|nr:hypothetical protein [Streptomyces yangpuensis]UUY52364.1 hypothetical protein NRK68_34395 [Streptomyces yangpuensis]